MLDMISIVTPMYNDEKFIKQTIESVRKQSYTNWEINIVDDCSIDGSAEIVKEYSNIDKRIKYYRLERNSGAAVTRNESMARANGRYLAFLDSDDLWHPDKLKNQISFMQEKKVSFSFTEYAVIDDSGNYKKKRIKSPARIDYLGLLCGSPMMCSSVVIDKEIIGPVSMPDIRSGQDYATWADILKNKTKYAYNAGGVYAYYRKQKKSLSAHKLSAFKRTWKINRKVLKVPFILSLACISIYAIRWIKKHYF